MTRWRFVIGMVVAIFFAAPLSARDGEGYLIIRRAPTFGNARWLELRIDGAKVEPVAYGHDFRTSLSAGHHVLVFRPSNTRWHTPSNRMSIQVAPGRTYQFTAFRDEDRVYLEPIR